MGPVGVLRAAAPKENEKQPEGRRDAGKLSMLPDMPFDILYEVRHGNIFVADNGIYEDAFGTCRYSLMSVPWIYCECRGSTKLFVIFSRASPRGGYGWPFYNVPEAQRPPPCPEDLAEIAYAKLLYNPCCMVCACVYISFHMSHL